MPERVLCGVASTWRWMDCELPCPSRQHLYSVQHGIIEFEYQTQSFLYFYSNPWSISFFSRNETGACVVHISRQFDGQKLKLPLTKVCSAWRISTLLQWLICISSDAHSLIAFLLMLPSLHSTPFQSQSGKHCTSAWSCRVISHRTHEMHCGVFLLHQILCLNQSKSSTVSTSYGPLPLHWRVLHGRHF